MVEEFSGGRLLGSSNSFKECVTAHQSALVDNRNSFFLAVVAQLVEHVIGNDEVSGSSPDNGSLVVIFSINYHYIF